MKHENLLSNFTLGCDPVDIETDSKTFLMLKSRQYGHSDRVMAFAMAQMAKENDERLQMILTHYKMLLSEIYLDKKIDAIQHKRIESLLDSDDKENVKLGTTLIQQKSGRRIEIAVDQQSRKATTREVKI